MKKRISLLLASLMLLMVLASCGGNVPPIETGSQGGETGSQTTTGGGDELPDDPNDGIIEVVPPVVEYDTPTSYDEMKEALEIFNNNEYNEKSNVYDYNSAIDVDVSTVMDNDTYEIGTGGVYRFSGVTQNGNIFIKAKEQNVTIILAGASITKRNTAPAIYAEDCSSVTIILADGTENYLEDGYSNGENGVIRVRNCNLTMDGRGSLTIVSNHKHGISNTKNLTINGGVYNITTPSDGGHAIYGKTGLTINSGKFIVNSGKSAFKSGDLEVKDEATGLTEETKGFIVVNYTNATLNCETNAFNCQGPVTVHDGIIKIVSTKGNGIDATENVTIEKAIISIESLKSAITTDLKVTIDKGASLKLATTGNGISADIVEITNGGVIYISTQALYEKYVKVEGEEEPKDLYVKENGEYVAYDKLIHDSKTTLYTRNNCKGIKADTSVLISGGYIGIDSFEDCINTTTLTIMGGDFNLSTTGDAIEATNTTINGANTQITVLSSNKGIKSDESLLIENGVITINALTDAINSDATEIKGGTLYLFDKIDKGREGKTTVSGGTIFMLSTTETAQLTSGAQDYLTRTIENKNLCVFGLDLKIKAGNAIKILKLPKDYTEKLAFYYSAPTLPDNVEIQFGTCMDGNKTNAYVFDGGSFTAVQTEVIE